MYSWMIIPSIEGQNVSISGSLLHYVSTSYVYSITANITSFLSTSAKDNSVQVGHLRQGGRAQSELSGTPRWQITTCPARIPRFVLHIALQSWFHCLFSLCWYRIVKWHCGVVANCDHMSEWVRWVHQQSVNRSGSHMQTSQTLWLPLPVLLSTSRCSHAPL